MDFINIITGKPTKKAKLAQKELELKRKEEKIVDLQTSNLEVQSSSLILGQENHSLNIEMKNMISSYEKREEVLKEKEVMLLDRENQIDEKQKNIDEKTTQLRNEEIHITARKSDLSRKENDVNKKDKDLDAERKEIKKILKETKLEKDNYISLKKELDTLQEDTKEKNKQANKHFKNAKNKMKEREQILENAKSLEEELKQKNKEFEEKREEIENTLKEKIAEYDRKTESLKKAKEMVDDIDFDTTDEGNQAKIVVKEAIRRAKKMTENLQQEFNILDEKYCEGTFKGFATPIKEIDTNFADLKSQLSQIINHIKENDLTHLTTSWVEYIENCLLTADENIKKWEYAEAHRNILFGVATCKNYELLLNVLQSWGKDDDFSDDTEEEDFVDYYDILDIDEDASKADIKKAYKKMAVKYHPDKQKNKTDDEKILAEKMMALVNQAKDVLIDDHKRAEFNKRRHNNRR